VDAFVVGFSLTSDLIALVGMIDRILEISFLVINTDWECELSIAS
jgi:hypothetical protein